MCLIIEATDMHEQRIERHCTSPDSSWQISFAVHLIRCFSAESESVISATFLSQSRLRAKASSWDPMPRPIRLKPLSKLQMQRIEEIMEWIPIVLITFKLLVLGAAMFFSIKSHHDKEKEEREEERQRQARASGTGSAIQIGQVQQRVEASQGATRSGPGR
jgi:hypothetical protein